MKFTIIALWIIACPALGTLVSWWAWILASPVLLLIAEIMHPVTVSYVVSHIALVAFAFTVAAVTGGTALLAHLLRRDGLRQWRPAPKRSRPLPEMTAALSPPGLPADPAPVPCRAPGPPLAVCPPVNVTNV